MRICIYEDHGAALLEPLALTRPVFALRCGARTLLERQQAAFAGQDIGLWVRPELAELCRWQYPDLPVNDGDWLRGQPALFVNGRWLPDDVVASDAPAVGVINGRVAFITLAEAEPPPEQT